MAAFLQLAVVIAVKLHRVKERLVMIHDENPSLTSLIKVSRRHAASKETVQLTITDVLLNISRSVLLYSLKTELNGHSYVIYTSSGMHLHRNELVSSYLQCLKLTVFIGFMLAYVHKYL